METRRMIRLAVPGDKRRIIELLRDSRAGAGFDDPTGPTGFVFPFDPAYAERVFLTHLTGSRTVCIVFEANGVPQGVLMAAHFDHPFGPVKVAKETVWWIDPDHRGTSAVRMLDAYEAWWRAQGCAFGGLAGMGDDPAVAKLYARRGYRAAEVHFLKAA